MTLLEQLEQVEERMESSFQKKRFDTFNLLAADRMSLIQSVLLFHNDEQLTSDIYQKTERWKNLFEERMERLRRGRYVEKTARTGRRINHSA